MAVLIAWKTREKLDPDCEREPRQYLSVKFLKGRTIMLLEGAEVPDTLGVNIDEFPEGTHPVNLVLKLRLIKDENEARDLGLI